MGNSCWSVLRDFTAHVSCEIYQQMNNVECADIDMESTGFSTIAKVLDETIYDDNRSLNLNSQKLNSHVQFGGCLLIQLIPGTSTSTKKI